MAIILFIPPYTCVMLAINDHVLELSHIYRAENKTEKAIIYSLADPLKRTIMELGSQKGPEVRLGVCAVKPRCPNVRVHVRVRLL